MPKRNPIDPNDFDDYLDEYGEDELEDLMEWLEMFPELDYMDDILDMDDEDFYTPAQ